MYDPSKDHHLTVWSCKIPGMSYFGETESATRAAAAKKPVWVRALGIACGIGIAAVLCLGLALALAVPGAFQLGCGLAAIAAATALFGGYDYFLYGRD